MTVDLQITVQIARLMVIQILQNFDEIQGQPITIFQIIAIWGFSTGLDGWWDILPKVQAIFLIFWSDEQLQAHVCSKGEVRNPLRSYDMRIICQNTYGQYRGTQSSQKVVIIDKKKVFNIFSLFRQLTWWNGLRFCGGRQQFSKHLTINLWSSGTNLTSLVLLIPQTQDN